MLRSKESIFSGTGCPASRRTFTSSPALSLSALVWKNVWATPFFPALPVLPIRWTKTQIKIESLGGACALLMISSHE